MKSKNFSLLIIATVIVFVCTCFAIAFTIGRKEKTVNGYVVSSGTSTSGVARISDDKLGFIHVEWDIREKESTDEFKTYTATITTTFVPGKAAIKAGENYEKWKCKSGYLHVAPFHNDSNSDINLISATPLYIKDKSITFNSQKSAENAKTYQWSFLYDGKSDNIFVLPAVYEFSVNKYVDISELSLKIDLKMAVCRGFSNRALANSFNTAIL